MRELVLSVIDATVTFGGKPLFEEMSFNIHEGDKIALVGKNGAGKTTLMHLITGERELDAGKRWIVPGARVGYLQQDVRPDAAQSVYDFIFMGLPEGQRNDDYRYRVDRVISPLDLDPEVLMGTLSGGQVRRASLARALVEEPEILMLDEPTNHLDLGAIEWLENFLRSYRGTLLCVSHDKTFLKNISNKIFWLDRGKMRVCPRGFEHFDEWSGQLLLHEEQELANRSKTLEAEIDWASRSPQARRKRNVRRLEMVGLARQKLKQDQSRLRQAKTKITLEPLDSEHTSHIVAEFYNVGRSFTDATREKKILEKFNLRIMKGDRIGILGKNGSGKTTFLKLLLGELAPDMGKVKLAKDLQVAYFDQKRRDVVDSNTLRKTLCPNGGDYVDVMGKTRHVCGYLRDFMFDPQSAEDKIGTLSGGQKNRLMLAKVLASPGSLLILDEPTNDLDMETLDMLEEILSRYNGTLLVVSHDRDFLDQCVTRILAFEGDTEVDQCIGGYSDYIAMKNGGVQSGVATAAPELVRIHKDGGTASRKAEALVNEPKKSASPDGLSNPERYELKRLPDKIAKYEKEIAELTTKLAAPEFYEKERDAFYEASTRAARLQQELDAAETRWLELEEKLAG